jgi:hypothetical protein
VHWYLHEYGQSQFPVVLQNSWDLQFLFPTEEFLLVNVTTSGAGLLNVPVSVLVASAPKLRTIHIENSDVNTADVALTMSCSSSAKTLTVISGDDSTNIEIKLVGRAAIAA